MKLTKADSSNIDGTNFTPDDPVVGTADSDVNPLKEGDGVLTVRFKGTSEQPGPVYQYRITEKMAQDFFEADSLGRFFNTTIRPLVSALRLDPEKWDDYPVDEEEEE